MANDTSRTAYTFDATLQTKDAGAVTASGADQVGGSNKILNVGNSVLEGALVIQVSAMDIASTDEHYDITVQGSNSATFASGIENLATLDLGATASRLGGAQDSVIGKYELRFKNVNRDTVYQYIRTYHTISGTTPSINYTAFIGIDSGMN